MRRIAVPEYYVGVAKNSQDPKATYKRMIQSYLKHNYPNCELLGD